MQPSDDMEPISIRTVDEAVIDLGKAAYIKRYVTRYKGRLRYYAAVYILGDAESEVRIHPGDTEKIEALHGRIAIHEMKRPFRNVYIPEDKRNGQ